MAIFHILPTRIVLLLTLVSLFHPISTTAGGSWVLPVLRQFDNADKAGQVAIANTFFARLDKEDFTDRTTHYYNSTPIDTVRANVWYWGSEYLYDANDYNNSRIYVEKALPLAERGHDNELKAGVYSVLTVLSTREGKYSDAIGWAQKVLEIDRKGGDKSNISSSLSNIAGIYLSAKQPAKALPYSLEAIKNSTAAGDSARMGIQHGMAAEIYHALGNNGKALEHARTAYGIDLARGNKGKAAVRLCQMATALIGIGRNNEAKAALLKALPELERVGNRQSFSIACNQLGEISLKGKDYVKAAEYFSKALPFFQEQGDIYNESHAQDGLYKALRTSNPQTAMAHLERYAALKDSLYNHDMQEKLSEYDARYRNEELRAENAEQRSRLILATATAITAVIMLVALMAIYIVSKLLKRREQTVEREQMNIKDEFITKVTDRVYLMVNAGKPVDVKSLAEQMNLSYGQFKRKLTTLTGFTPVQFVQRIKVKKAQRLMQARPGMSFNDVAAQCGFNDYSNFVRAFKNVIGITPTQYVRQM